METEDRPQTRDRQPIGQLKPGLGVTPKPREGAFDANRRWKSLASQAAFLLVIGGIWQTAIWLRLLDPFWVPSPNGIITKLFSGIFTQQIQEALAVTLGETLVGFGISAIAGVLTGLVLFEFKWLWRMTRPFIMMFNNLPRMVFAPLLVLWFGIGWTSRIVFIIITVYIIVILNTVAGLQGINSDHLRLARVLGATRRETFVKFRLPSAVPTIFVGLQVGMNMSLVSAIVSEILTGGVGLGALVARYTDTYDFDLVFALILIMAILGTGLSQLITLLESYLLRWHRYEYRGLS